MWLILYRFILVSIYSMSTSVTMTQLCTGLFQLKLKLAYSWKELVTRQIFMRVSHPARSSIQDINAPRVWDLRAAEFCLSELHAQAGVHTRVLSSQFCFSPTTCQILVQLVFLQQPEANFILGVGDIPLGCLCAFRTLFWAWLWNSHRVLC